MSIESKGGKRELVGDPDILNILVFGDIWITQSTSCVCFIYDPDVHHHRNTARNSISANHLEVEGLVSLYVCPLVLYFPLTLLSTSPLNSSGNVAVLPDA